MTDQITDAVLDERLRSADPLTPGSLPTQTDTEAALRRLLASGQDAGPTRRGIRVQKRIKPITASASAGASVKQGSHTLRVFCGTGIIAPADGVDGETVHSGKG